MSMGLLGSQLRFHTFKPEFQSVSKSGTDPAFLIMTILTLAATLNSHC